MDTQEQIQYWSDTAEHDLKTAEHLFEKGDYAWCLFIGHLVLEKFLKALYVAVSSLCDHHKLSNIL